MSTIHSKFDRLNFNKFHSNNKYRNHSIERKFYVLNFSTTNSDKRSLLEMFSMDLLTLQMFYYIFSLNFSSLSFVNLVWMWSVWLFRVSVGSRLGVMTKQWTIHSFKIQLSNSFIESSYVLLFVTVVRWLLFYFSPLHILLLKLEWTLQMTKHETSTNERRRSKKNTLGRINILVWKFEKWKRRLKMEMMAKKSVFDSKCLFSCICSTKLRIFKTNCCFCLNNFTICCFFFYFSDYLWHNYNYIEPSDVLGKNT